MKLAKGVGSIEEGGGCWMALADYYTRGALDWSDQPECVDPMIRELCIFFNDWCVDGEREELIGPHLWAPIGTQSFDFELFVKRLDALVEFVQPNNFISGLSTEELASEAIRAFKSHGYIYSTAHALHVAWRACTVGKRAIGPARVGKVDFLDLILKLCAMGTTRELPAGAVSKEQALQVVCGVSCDAEDAHVKAEDTVPSDEG